MNDQSDGSCQKDDEGIPRQAFDIDKGPWALLEEFATTKEETEWIGGALERLKQRAPDELHSRQWRPCDTLAGRYILGEPLGSGGYGVVYRARDTQLDREVAIKLLHPTYSRLEYYRQRFEREAKAASQVIDEHVVRVYDAQTTDDSTCFFIVMELVDGTALNEWKGRGGIAYRDIADKVLQAAKGLEVAHHRGLVHRDIKCSNLLVDKHGRVKIADFGLARITTDDVDAASLTEQFGGTLSYMSPEQLGASGGCDHRTDIYSLGVVLYELLGDSRPFRGTPAAIMDQIKAADPPSLLQLNPSCPRDLATIAAKCLRKEPDKRYTSAQTLADDLQRWMRDEPILARPAGKAERSWRWCRRNPLVAALWLTILSVAIVSALLATNLYFEKQRVNNALQLAYQLLEGIQTSQYKSVDDAYSGILQGTPPVSPQHHDALVPLFMAMLELQTAATQARSPSDDTLVGGTLDLMGQLGALKNAHSAKSYLDQALSRSDRIGLAWLLRAQVRMEVLGHRKEDVMADWQHAVDLLPECSAARSGRGWCYWGLQNRDYDNAFADFERAIEIDPRNEYAHFGLAQILYLQDKDEEAAQHYETAFRLPPRYNISSEWRISRAYDASDAHWHVSVSAYKSGDLDGAIHHTLRAIELAKPSNRTQLWLNLLKLLEDCNPQQALSLNSDLHNLTTVHHDSEPFQRSREVFGLVAAAHAGILKEDDLAAIIGTSPEPSAIATEFDSKFSNYFAQWAESAELSDLARDQVRRLHQAMR